MSDDTHGHAKLWFNGLGFTTGGSIVRDYLAHTTAAWQFTEIGMQRSAAEDCSWQLRAFIYAWNVNADVCGISATEPTPKYIHIVNLLGWSGVLVSQRPFLLLALMQLSSPSGMNSATARGVRAMIDHCDAHPGTSLLHVYSAPFRTIVGNTHWDLRTVQRPPTGRVVDGELCYNSWDACDGKLPSRRSCTLSACETSAQATRLASAAKVISEQRVHHLDSCAFVDGTDDAQQHVCHAATTKEMTAIALCNALKTERVATRAEHKQALLECTERHARVHALEREQACALREKLATLEDQLASEQKRSALATTDVSEARCELYRREVEFDTERRVLVNKIASTAQQHAEDGMAQAAKTKAVKTSATRATVEAARVVTEMRAESSRVHAQMKAMANTMKSEHVRATERLISDHLVAEARQADALCKLRSGLAARGGAAVPIAVHTADQSTETVHVSSRADLQLGELSAQHARLVDEMDTKTRALARANGEIARLHALLSSVSNDRRYPDTVAPPDPRVELCLVSIQQNIAFLADTARRAPAPVPMHTVFYAGRQVASPQRVMQPFMQPHH